MAKPLITDELWDLIEPLLPVSARHPKGGRIPLPDRDVLTGVLFVLKTGIPWKDLPTEMGCGSGVTCRWRLREWQNAGVWDQIRRILMGQLGSAGQFDWSRAGINNFRVHAVLRGPVPDPIERIVARTA